MLFNSFEYLIFLPIVFVLYWFVFKQIKWQNLLVLISSYVFYGWWDWRFLILIFITTACSYGSGLLISKSVAGNNKKFAKIWCGVNIVLNLLILCYFKYFIFFVDNLKVLFNQFGFQLDWFTLDVLLPVGISFYTFQALSYTIDVYRKDVAATKDFIAFASFISFFPQLVAGPIERATNLLPQFQQYRRFDYSLAVSGMRQILLGFFKKMVIADNCAGFANSIFAESSNLSGSTIFLGGLFFTFQIYGDFSGYSDIAIGTAKLFGIRLMKNFDLPYFSQNMAEFWRRWHISLNKWFIDYVYIPLGGSRNGRFKTIRNILIVFSLSGLWYGADWTFILWGVYNGVLVVLSSAIVKNPNRKKNLNDFSLTPLTTLRILGTFLLVVIGWILFRSDNMEMASQCFSAIFSKSIFAPIDFSVISGNMAGLASTILMVFLLMLFEYRMRKFDFTLEVVSIKSKILRWMIYGSVFFAILLFTGEQEEFIYFQF